ncbi:universal stress protein [Methylobacillus flagellatus]|uniref:universal stress protein n=1 Tax=Methylobacillus flagellatus TaxID=405 RepID=UPI002853A564|nr:universal stress protein [Methylobacillus flagellatus]MDR5170986.1 universal stress protein [Methylobacillus flagellatus]
MSLMKDIAVFFDGSEPGQRTLQIAARLAISQGAHLIGITVASHGSGLPDYSFARGAAIPEEIHRQQLVIAAQLADISQSLNATAWGLGIDAELRVVAPNESSAESALHSLYCDLLVVGRPQALGAPFAWSPSEVLRRTGVPILILPESWRAETAGRRITIAWNASRQSRRALVDALPLLAAAEDVQLLIVDPRQDAGAYGKEAGADMAAYLARHGVSVELRRVDSQGKSTAEAIMDEVLAYQADMLVFGAYSQLQLSEAIFGGVTRTLLADAPLPLFVSR